MAYAPLQEWGRYGVATILDALRAKLVWTPMKDHRSVHWHQMLALMRGQEILVPV